MTVEELLEQQKIPYKVSPKDFVVRCLNPEHDDHNPSMRIDRVTGIYNCFSCGYKGNLFMSIFFRIKKNINLNKITKLNCEIVKKSIYHKIKKKIKIKKPNDLLINNRKFCGILQETIEYKNEKGGLPVKNTFISAEVPLSQIVSFPVMSTDWALTKNGKNKHKNTFFIMQI